MVILNLYAVVVFRPEREFLFKSASSYCVEGEGFASIPKIIGGGGASPLPPQFRRPYDRYFIFKDIKIAIQCQLRMINHLKTRQ